MHVNQTVPTPIRNAFMNINVKASAHTKEGKRIAGLVHDAIMSKTGERMLKDNHKLSFETYQQLKKEGVLV